MRWPEMLGAMRYATGQASVPFASVVKKYARGMRCREEHRKKFREKPYEPPPQTGGFVGFSAKVF